MLVIDRNLEQIGKDPYIRKMSLLSSDWMARLWTLQEATEAFERVWVRFKDDTLRLALLLEDSGPTYAEGQIVSRLLKEQISGQLQYTFLPFLYGKRAAEGTYASNQINFVVPLIENMSRRATSNAEDEYACMMSMLRMDPKLLQGESSMASILRRLQSIPQNLFFWHGERVDEPGLRWAPASFLTQPP